MKLSYMFYELGATSEPRWSEVIGPRLKLQNSEASDNRIKRMVECLFASLLVGVFFSTYDISLCIFNYILLWFTSRKTLIKVNLKTSSSRSIRLKWFRYYRKEIPVPICVPYETCIELSLRMWLVAFFFRNCKVSSYDCSLLPYWKIYFVFIRTLDAVSRDIYHMSILGGAVIKTNCLQVR